jgi:2-succinyl-5-enolpyruvyl-6-hydroxy-3-cyclohexene-1-carboxylate synthase
MTERPEDVQATFAATLVDEWALCGVRHAVVAPGSRSTPLALALAASGDITVHVHLDERSAGFLALGTARETGEPTIVLTTSGTAAAELHPAVVEAHLSQVPLLVCTADRPPELRDVGAPQAIDQAHLFGRAVRWFHDPGVADPVTAARWRPLAARAHAESTTVGGPVHLNLPFREPLLGQAGALPPRRTGGDGWTRQPHGWRPADPAVTPAGVAGRRGVIVAGGAADDGEAVVAVAGALGWPVLLDARMRGATSGAVVVSHADGILRSALAREALRPDLVLRLGEPPASRVLAEWVAASKAGEVVAAGSGRWIDPSGTASTILDLDPGLLLAAWRDRLDGVTPVDGGEWLERWRTADDAAARAIAATLAEQPATTEPGVARAVLDALPNGARLVVSSSMPIRDVEWYARARAGVTVRANRGANGIDGLVSTAVGAAIGSGAPTVLLVGDLAFLHDANGLLGAARRSIDLVVVVVDNDGGGIFSFLPQASALPDTTFEDLFGTPHGLDLVEVATAHGVGAAHATDLGADVGSALRAGGVTVLVVRTERGHNEDVHRSLSESITAAVDATVTGWS